jgi:hypothetical protein
MGPLGRLLRAHDSCSLSRSLNRLASACVPELAPDALLELTGFLAQFPTASFGESTVIHEETRYFSSAEVEQ